LIINLTLADGAEAHESIRSQGYDEHGKEFLDAKTGDSYFRKDEEWHDVTQIVNRRDKRYRKKIVRNLRAKSSEMRTCR
jgi:isocitrate dehydrogenase kinase/phosphatase